MLQLSFRNVRPRLRALVFVVRAVLCDGLNGLQTRAARSVSSTCARRPPRVRHVTKATQAPTAKFKVCIRHFRQWQLIKCHTLAAVCSSNCKVGTCVSDGMCTACKPNIAFHGPNCDIPCLFMHAVFTLERPCAQTHAVQTVCPASTRTCARRAPARRSPAPTATLLVCPAAFDLAILLRLSVHRPAHAGAVTCGTPHCVQNMCSSNTCAACYSGYSGTTCQTACVSRTHLRNLWSCVAVTCAAQCFSQSHCIADGNCNKCNTG